MKDSKPEELTININKLHIGIVMMLIGIVAFISADLIFYGEFGLKLVGYILSPVGCGFITKHILPKQKYSFGIGLVLGIIGIVIAICLKSKNEELEENEK